MDERPLLTEYALTRRNLFRAGGALGIAAAVTGAHVTGLTPAEQALASAPRESTKLNVLFIGAHPDDEASNLGVFGQWNEYHDIKAGVITVTRGEAVATPSDSRKDLPSV